MIGTSLGEVPYDFIYDNVFDNPVIRDHPNSLTRRRAATGFNSLGHRTYTHPTEFTLRARNTTGGAGISIGITSVSGALVGKIRTDIEKSIVQSLEFVIDNNGCADFRLVLNDLPPFPLLPFSILNITIGDTEFAWYSGEINYPDNKGTQHEYYEFKGFGSRQALKQLKAFTTYPAGMDIGAIIDDIAANWIAPYCAIKYNASKIETNTGVLIFEDAEMGNFPIEQNLNTFRDMAVLDDIYFQWGVDGDNEFFFERRSRHLPVKTLYIPDKVSTFTPKDNFDSVKNVIMVQRQEGLGSGGAGLVVGGLYNDATSVKKYGRRELTYLVPGSFGQDTIDALGNALLEAKKEPQQTAQVTGFPLIDGSSYLPEGLYRFIMPLEDYELEVNSLDDSGEFTVVNTGDLVVSNDTNILVSGTGSLKLAYTNANNSTIVTPITVPYQIKKIRFYVRGTKTGGFIKAGVGISNFNENLTTIQIPTQNTFFLFEWDVSAFNLRGDLLFGFLIDDNAAGTVYFDKLSALVVGNRFYKMTKNKAKYIIQPNRFAIDCEFGDLTPKMESYVGGLITLSEQLKFSNEVR